MIKRFDLSTIEFTSLIELRDHFGEIPEYEAEWFRESVRDAREKAQTSFDEVEDLIDKTMHYYSRVYLIGSQSRIWKTIRESLEDVDYALWEASPSKWLTDLDVDVEKYRDALNELGRRGLEAKNLYGEFAESVRLRLSKDLRSRMVNSRKIDWGASVGSSANPGESKAGETGLDDARPGDAVAGSHDSNGDSNGHRR